jgi:hypothetical protein
MDVRAAPAVIDRQIGFERINSLYAITEPMLFGGFAFTVLTGLLLAPTVPRPLLVTWLVIKIALTIARLVDGRLFLRDRHRSLRQRHWRCRFVAGVVLDSVSWGLLALLCMPTDDPAINGVLLAALVAVASAGAIALSADRFAAGVSMVLVLGPLVEQQALTPTLLSRYTAAGLVIYGALLFL